MNGLNHFCTEFIDTNMASGCNAKSGKLCINLFQYLDTPVYTSMVFNIGKIYEKDSSFIYP